MVKLVIGEHLKDGLAQTVENAAAGVLNDSSRVVDLDVFLREGKSGDFVVANRPLKNWEILEISRRGGRSLEIPAEYGDGEEQAIALKARMKLELTSPKKKF